MAENLITGTGISSSELSLSEYVRACVSIGTETCRDGSGLDTVCLYSCRFEGRLGRDAKWEEPIGVGDAVAISRNLVAG